MSGNNQVDGGRSESGRMMLASYLERSGEVEPVLDCIGGRYVTIESLGITAPASVGCGDDDDEFEREAKPAA